MKPLSRVLSEIPVSAPTAVDALVKERRAAGEEIISFCVGEPDFPTPEEVGRAGAEAIFAGKTKYTHPSGTKALREAAAETMQREYRLNYAPEQVIVTTGAKFAVYAAATTLCDPGDEVILPAPYWPSYTPILRLCGAKAVVLDCPQENDYKLTPGQLASAVTPRTKALILNNPNNPSGMVYDRSELSALAEVCVDQDIYCIADEIYGKLVYDGRDFAPMASLPGMAVRTVTVNGVSKAYAMTGWRVGFVAANPEIARRIGIYVNHTTGGACSVSQEAALFALREAGDDTDAMCAAFSARRDALLPLLSALPGIRFARPQGAFYVLLDAAEAIERMDGIENDFDFAMTLLKEEKVALVPCTDYGAPGCLRLSYTLGDAEMREGVERIGRFIRRRLT